MLNGHNRYDRHTDVAARPRRSPNALCDRFAGIIALDRLVDVRDGRRATHRGTPSTVAKRPKPIKTRVGFVEVGVCSDYSQGAIAMAIFFFKHVSLLDPSGATGFPMSISQPSNTALPCTMSQLNRLPTIHRPKSPVRRLAGLLVLVASLIPVSTPVAAQDPWTYQPSSP